MNNDVKVLFSEMEIEKIVSDLASEISRDYKGKKLLLVGILKGASVFMSDLMRKIDLDLEIDFMDVSSYGASTESSGVVRILKDLDSDVQNKEILIIEDIIDTGLTLSYLTKMLLSRKPKSVKICTLLNKPARRKIDINVDYVGKNIEDLFVVGYGIDFAEKYRNLPFIGVYEKE